eukprot:CAMPEP_0114984630 /NCGR_PEP_ID=MMETSP0216-20121206/7386_1 /TAXON_ID=223996 /ORGANISM="Protocruzia adherens, Strain Boccale" /LENGTH=930 /DNA_ID=CAMNT_0002346793 /DNA_START=28 /DNA_END=2820 /DNA_ORIENTATION=+
MKRAIWDLFKFFAAIYLFVNTIQTVVEVENDPLTAVARNKYCQGDVPKMDQVVCEKPIGFEKFIFLFFDGMAWDQTYDLFDRLGEHGNVYRIRNIPYLQSPSLWETFFSGRVSKNYAGGKMRLDNIFDQLMYLNRTSVYVGGEFPVYSLTQDERYTASWSSTDYPTDLFMNLCTIADTSSYYLDDSIVMNSKNRTTVIEDMRNHFKNQMDGYDTQKIDNCFHQATEHVLQKNLTWAERQEYSFVYFNNRPDEINHTYSKSSLWTALETTAWVESMKAIADWAHTPESGYPVLIGMSDHGGQAYKGEDDINMHGKLDRGNEPFFFVYHKDLENMVSADGQWIPSIDVSASIAQYFTGMNVPIKSNGIARPVQDTVLSQYVAYRSTEIQLQEKMRLFGIENRIAPIPHKFGLKDDVDVRDLDDSILEQINDAYPKVLDDYLYDIQMGMTAGAASLYPTMIAFMTIFVAYLYIKYRSLIPSIQGFFSPRGVITNPMQFFLYLFVFTFWFPLTLFLPITPDEILRYQFFIVAFAAVVSVFVKFPAHEASEDVAMIALRIDSNWLPRKLTSKLFSAKTLYLELLIAIVAVLVYAIADSEIFFQKFDRQDQGYLYYFNYQLAMLGSYVYIKYLTKEDPEEGKTFSITSRWNLIGYVFSIIFLSAVWESFPGKESCRWERMWVSRFAYVIMLGHAFTMASRRWDKACKYLFIDCFVFAFWTHNNANRLYLMLVYIPVMELLSVVSIKAKEARNGVSFRCFAIGLLFASYTYITMGFDFRLEASQRVGNRTWGLYKEHFPVFTGAIFILHKFSYYIMYGLCYLRMTHLSGQNPKADMSPKAMERIDSRYLILEEVINDIIFGFLTLGFTLYLYIYYVRPLKYIQFFVWMTGYFIAFTFIQMFKLVQSITCCTRSNKNGKSSKAGLEPVPSEDPEEISK